MNNSKFIKDINRIFHDIESRDYSDRHPEILLGEKNWWETYFNKYTKNFSKNLVILDIGSGDGFVPKTIYKFLKKEDKIICYDISLEMLNRIPKLKNISLIGGDAENLPFEDSSVDVVTMNSIIHHLPDYKSFLKEVDRILKRKGIVFIGHEPNDKFFNSSLIRFLVRIYRIFGGVKINDGMKKEINDRLKTEGITDKVFSKKEIIKFVEYNSIAEHENIKPSSNFNKEIILSYLKNYQILESTTNSTFLYRSKIPLRKALNRLINLFTENQGSMFGLVLRK